MHVHVLSLLPWQNTQKEYVLIQYENIFREWFFWEPRYRAYPRVILYAKPGRGFTDSTKIDTLTWGTSHATYRMAFDPRTTDLRRAVERATISNELSAIDWWTIPARTFP